jgi:hypothetical protein
MAEWEAAVEALVLILCLPTFPAHPEAWAFMSVTAELAHNPRPCLSRTPKTPKEVLVMEDEVHAKEYFFRRTVNSAAFSSQSDLRSMAPFHDPTSPSILITEIY